MSTTAETKPLTLLYTIEFTGPDGTVAEEADMTPDEALTAIALWQAAGYTISDASNRITDTNR
jgi:hypothetical protein